MSDSRVKGPILSHGISLSKTHNIDSNSFLKFGYFFMNFISQIFYFLNSQVIVHVFYKVFSDFLLTRTLNSQGNQFANISKSSCKYFQSYSIHFFPFFFFFFFFILILAVNIHKLSICDVMV